MKNKNPCSECVVRAICTEACDNFIGYLTFHEWIKNEMQRIIVQFPTSFKEIASYLRCEDEGNDQVVLRRLHKLRQNIRNRKIL